MQNYNFACGAVCLQSLVSDIESGWEEGTEENIWTGERWSEERLEKTA
jgi:hypothetical protein